MIAEDSWNLWVEDCLKWRGKVLKNSPKAHWCNDWDDLPVSEETPDELDCCTCYSEQGS